MLMFVVIPTFLKNSIVEGKCLPVIGAGLSMNGKLPSGQRMPNWDELVEPLATEISTAETDPLEIAQEYENKFHRTALLETLEKLLHIKTVEPSHVHREFVRIRSFDVVCTTNFDSLLEKTYQQEGILFETIITTQQISLHGASSSVKILKIHGDFSHPEKIVFTKNDYTNYSKDNSAMIAFLTGQLMTKTPLYIGFSMKDPNFRQIKQIVEDIMKESVRKGFILTFDSPAEEIEQYQKMGLIPIPLATNKRTKGETLLEFLKEINYTDETEVHVPVNLSVASNKRILFHGQTLEVQTVSNPQIQNAPTFRIFDENEELIYTDTMDDVESIGGIRTKKIVLLDSKWIIEKQYTIIAEQNGETANDSFFISAPVNIVAQTDRSVYIYGSVMIFTAIVPHAYTGSEIVYEMLDEEKNPFFRGTIPVDSEDTGIFQEVIDIQGEPWRKRGSEIEVVLHYGSQKASVAVFASNFGATIELNQKVYSWTDKVYITVIAPDFSIRTDQLNTIGSDPENPITVSTSRGKITGYKLVETSIGSGIFVGEIKLSGFPGHELSNFGNRAFPMGITRGSGSSDGLIACTEDDGISISFRFSDDEDVIGSALIRMNIGEISWLEAAYLTTDYGIVRVIDPDMNLNPEEIDKFKIRIWSDSDPVGIEIDVYETNEASGVFEGVVAFTHESSSKNGKLRVSEGDTIVAEYVDRTLPDPFPTNDNLSITGTAFIKSSTGKIIAPLDRISIKNLILNDSSNIPINTINKQQIVKLGARLVNNQERDQKLTLIAKIISDTGSELLSQETMIKAQSSADLTIEWNAENQGHYTIQFYVWESLDNPTALSSPFSTEVNVV